MLEAYQTSKGVGIIASDEGKQRGPYTVRVLLDGGKAVIRAKNPAQQRKRTLQDARAWLRVKLGPLRKSNPRRISQLIDQAESAGEQWGQRHKKRKGGRMPSQDALYRMGRDYSGDVLEQEGALPTGHRELIALGYKTGVRRGVRNPSARDKYQVWGGVYGTEPIGRPKAAKSAISAAIKHALTTNHRVSVRGNAPDAVLYIEKVSPNSVSVLVTREFSNLSRIFQDDVERMRGVVKRNPSASMSYEEAVRRFGKQAVDRQLQWQESQQGRPTPAIDHSMLSPSGRVSTRARKAAMDRERVRLFGPLGYFVDAPRSSADLHRDEIEKLRRRAKQDREFATMAGKAQAKKLLARADKAEAEADALEFGRCNPGLLDPSGASLYGEFHGKPSTKVSTFEQVSYSREDLAQLGILVSLKVHLVTAQKAEITFSAEGEDRVILASSPDGKQLYFIGGDQTLNLQRLGLGSAKWYRDLMVLGVCTEVTYRTRKGFDQFQLIDYYHALGEETGDKPQLLYDTINDELSIAGGQYKVKPEGIVN